MAALFGDAGCKFQVKGQGAGCRVQGAGCRVQGAGYELQVGSGLKPVFNL